MMPVILVVDDSPTMRRMVIASLRGSCPGTFLEAATGLEALEMLAVSPASLIILDLNMPDMHGLEVLRFVRQHPVFRTVPVIVLTTRDDDTSRLAAMSAGATLYLTKPFKPGEFANEVQGVLRTPVKP
jgi:two-component system chemotaxis response regulator CheY